MRTSPEIKAFAGAFLEAQKNIKGVKKEAENPFYKSRYATLDSCWDACKGALHAQGISVSQAPSILEGARVLTTRLLHTSGEWIEGDYELKPAKDDPQGMGSAITYARRYALCAMVGLCAEEDDDGNAASRPSPAQRSTPKSNGNGTEKAAKQALAHRIKEWTGCNTEEIGDRAKRIFASANLRVNGSASPAQCEKAVAFIDKMIEDGISYEQIG